MDPNRFDRLDEKSGLGVEPRPLQSPIKQGRSVYLGCSVVATRVVRDEEAGGLGPLTPSTFPLYIVNTVAALPINPPLPSLVQY